MADSSKIIPIFRAEALLIPLKVLTNSDVVAAHKRFTYRFFNEKACKPCENLPDRFNDICAECQHFQGSKQTSKIVEKEGNSFLSMPRGASKKVKKWLVGRGYDKRYKVLDRTPEAPAFSRRIKMIRDLYSYQPEAVETLLEKKFGILDSPPRSGKTVMGAAVICRIGKKTIILAAQRQWLLQFQETFVGGANNEPFTNCRHNQIKLCTTLKDFQETDICLATFSRFKSPKGQKLLEKIRELFGCVMTDEIQGTPALMTSRILARFNSEYNFGLSGTVERKVTEEIQIAKDIIGPIIYECEVTRLRPKVVTFYTGIKFKDPARGARTGWTSFQTRVETHQERREKIIKEVLRYARAGHLVFIPLTRVDAILKWTRDINYETEVPGFALPYFGGMKKFMLDKHVAMARNYECRVFVGNMSMISTGLNIPRASCIFQVTPTSNIPKCDQRVSRILTPFEGKPQPILVQVLDDSDLMRACMQKEWWGCIKPRFDPIIMPEEEKALMNWFAASEKNKKQMRFQNARDGLE